MDLALRPYSFGVSWEQSYGYAQAIQTTFANLDRVLEAYGARREHVVQTTVYVKELGRHLDAMGRLHAEYFGAHRPTSTVLGVVDLALPPQLVEIAAVAVVPERT